MAFRIRRSEFEAILRDFNVVYNDGSTIARISIWAPPDTGLGRIWHLSVSSVPIIRVL